MIPLPIRPPPITATVFRDRGLTLPSEMPLTFLVARCAKKRCTSALCARSRCASLKAAVSRLRPAAPPAEMPSRIESRQRWGWARPGMRREMSRRARRMISCATAKGSSLSVRVKLFILGLRNSAMSSAIFLAVSNKSLSSATASTRPNFNPSTAPIGVLVMIIWTLLRTPTRRGRRWVPPKPGRTPRVSSGRPSLVAAVATRALQAMATSSPPPRATPRTAATEGLGPASKKLPKFAWISSVSTASPELAFWN
mmetsp:Transcript_16115/g.29014  ORF Transcript_16115/g.29014 Transcript_16115/m.29014 type:complete len:254 (-) Transcript_16115:363-1124(-)